MRRGGPGAVAAVLDWRRQDVVEVGEEGEEGEAVPRPRRNVVAAGVVVEEEEEEEAHRRSFAEEGVAEEGVAAEGAAAHRRNVAEGAAADHRQREATARRDGTAPRLELRRRRPADAGRR